MEIITLNGRELAVQGIKELKPGMSVQEASTKTKKNGIDEIYFNVDGKNFLAYGDSLKIGELSENRIAKVTYNGRAGNVVAYENEINSLQEGMKTGALSGIKKTKDAIFGAVSNIVTTIGPTSALVAAGGTIGLTGLALWRGGTSISAVVGTAGASPLGNMLGDILKNGSIGALKVITVAGVVGFGVTALTGAIGGMSEASTAEKDYSTIAAVTKDGTEGVAFTAPTNTTQTAQPSEQTNSQQPTMGIGVFSRPQQSNPNVQFGAVSGFLNNR
ncbi:MAG: hypothetical protein U0354_03885 [Candidatus Sericytochromatia bacterium]